MMRNLVTSLLVHERVTTTDAKAKELRRVAERLVTKAARLADLSEESPTRLSQADRARLVHARRVVAKHLRPVAVDRQDNEVDVLWKLFTVIGPRFAERPGGYTRIVKLPKLRKGDGAPLSIVEFVDFDDYAEAVAGDEDAGAPSEAKRGLLGNIFGGRRKKETEDVEEDEEDEE